MWKDPAMLKLHKEIRKGKTLLKVKTPYNTVELTFYPKSRKIVMWLNGYMQFISGLPEKEYHFKLYGKPVIDYFLKEKRTPEKVLVLGGGDGLGVRELLKFPQIREITLVDIDKTVTDLARKNKILRTLNRNALNSSRVKIVNTDALKYLKTAKDRYDLIIVDFPDPDYDMMENDEFLKKHVNPLYTCRAYKLIASYLKKGNLLSIQVSGSPIVLNRVKNCLKKLRLQILGKDRGVNFEQFFLYARR